MELYCQDGIVVKRMWTNGKVVAGDRQREYK